MIMPSTYDILKIKRFTGKEVLIIECEFLFIQNSRSRNASFFISNQNWQQEKTWCPRISRSDNLRARLRSFSEKLNDFVQRSEWNLSRVPIWKLLSIIAIHSSLPLNPNPESTNQLPALPLCLAIHIRPHTRFSNSP